MWYHKSRVPNAVIQKTFQSQPTTVNFFMNARAAECCSKRRKGPAAFFARMAMFLARRCRMKECPEEIDAANAYAAVMGCPRDIRSCKTDS